MSSNTYTPNPLRPYYIPPAHDFLTGKISSTGGAANAAASSASAAVAKNATSGGAAGAFSSATRDMLSDLDYSDYLETPSIGESVRNLFDSALMGYTSVLILQPFKVAKTVLQCQHLPKRKGRVLGTAPGSVTSDAPLETPVMSEFGSEWKGNDEALSDEDEDPPYFASNDMENSADWSTSQAARRKSEREPSRGRKMIDRRGVLVHDPEATSAPPSTVYIKTAKVGVLGDVLHGIWNKEGAWGIWKGANSTFLYIVLTSTFETWAQSLVSALCALPDPAVTEIADSPYPLTSLGVSVLTSAAIALLLSPLDIVRTRLMLAPVDEKPRGMLTLLQSLPSKTCPPSLLIPTALHATIPSLMTFGTPWFLRAKLGIDAVMTPASYNIATFLNSVVELFMRLPVETALRRGQLAYSTPRNTIVPVGKYDGIVGTLSSIYSEEDCGGKLGVEGLFRGWRLGVWGLVGMRVMGLFGGTYAANAGSSAAPF